MVVLTSVIITFILLINSIWPILSRQAIDIQAMLTMDTFSNLILKLEVISKDSEVEAEVTEPPPQPVAGVERVATSPTPLTFTSYC